MTTLFAASVRTRSLAADINRAYSPAMGARGLSVESFPFDCSAHVGETRMIFWIAAHGLRPQMLASECNRPKSALNWIRKVWDRSPAIPRPVRAQPADPARVRRSSDTMLLRVLSAGMLLRAWRLTEYIREFNFTPTLGNACGKVSTAADDLCKLAYSTPSDRRAQTAPRPGGNHHPTICPRPRPD